MFTRLQFIQVASILINNCRHSATLHAGSSLIEGEGRPYFIVAEKDPSGWWCSADIDGELFECDGATAAECVQEMLEWADAVKKQDTDVRFAWISASGPLGASRISTRIE